jgi:signal transduction histidine kinase
MAERRRPTAGVRRRVTATATAVVVVVLVLAGFGLVVAQERFLTANVEEAAEDGADAVEAAIRAGELPEILGGFGDDDTVALVTARDGRLVAATRARHDPDEDYAEHVRTVDGPGPDGPFEVRVAATLDDVAESRAVLVASLAVAIPLVSAALAVLMWCVVGRTLRPVEEAVERQQRFVADASHELRGPLTRMRTELEVDLDHPRTADPAATHRSVLQETVALQRLVDDLLHLARMDAGAEPSRPRAPVDLDDVVLRHAATVRAAGITVDTTGVGAAQVLGDAAQLGRAVGNLADNAARHARSTVTFSLREDGPTAILTVADDGPGIPAAQRQRVFERFTRLDDARASGTGGTGLGLAIARDVIRRHGGTIKVDGAGDGAGAGAGARFVITLPKR